MDDLGIVREKSVIITTSVILVPITNHHHSAMVAVGQMCATRLVSEVSFLKGLKSKKLSAGQHRSLLHL